MGSLFQIGGPSGNQIKNQSDGLAIRNAADSAHQNLSIKQASGSVPAHAVNGQDLRDQSPLMQFSFNSTTSMVLVAAESSLAISTISGVNF